MPLSAKLICHINQPYARHTKHITDGLVNIHSTINMPKYRGIWWWWWYIAIKYSGRVRLHQNIPILIRCAPPASASSASLANTYFIWLAPWRVCIRFRVYILDQYLPMHTYIYASCVLVYWFYFTRIVDYIIAYILYSCWTIWYYDVDTNKNIYLYNAYTYVTKKK